jgi:DNA polymerase III gamma/tau subunit
MAQDKDITIPLIESTFKTTKIATYVVGLLSALGKGKKDTKKALEIIENIVNDGIDIKYFINTVIEKLHEELLIKMEIIKEPSILEVSFSVDELKLLTEMFTSVYGEIKNAVLLQLPLELAVIEWGDGSQEPVVQKKQQLAEGNQQNWSSGSGASTVNDLRKQVGTMKKLKALYGTTAQDKKEEEDTIAQVASPTVELMQTNGDGPVTNEWIELFWKNYIIEMKKYNHTVAGVLRGCNVKSYADQNLIIQTSYKFHKERLDDIKNRDALLKIGKLLTGKDVTIKVELRSKD